MSVRFEVLEVDDDEEDYEQQRQISWKTVFAAVSFLAVGVVS